MTNDPLLQLLREHPNCRVTFASSRTRRRRIGDVKTIRGKKHVCQQVFLKHEGAYLVRNGRPVLEWVLAEDAQ